MVYEELESYDEISEKQILFSSPLSFSLPPPPMCNYHANGTYR
jgi:hypothetical protein